MLNAGRLRVILSLILLVGITYLPQPVFSQGGNSNSTVQNLIVNGGFEGGFQEDFGIGFGWGGFSNGNAVVGWSYDDWEAVVSDGNYAQRIEIKDTLDLNRYAGIYQTMSVIPGEQYKLTIKGLIRSTEGDITLSDYGYRLQYAIDYNGDIAWELVPQTEWKELSWDEQPLYDPPDDTYRIDTLETTITAKSDKLTLFIRGWKKWLNNGNGIYDLDEISFVGPAPAGFQSPVAETASTGDTSPQPVEELVAADFSAQQSSEHAADISPTTEAQPQSETQTEATTEATTEAETPAETETPTEAEPTTEAAISSETSEQVAAPADTSSQTQSTELPVSGRGRDNSVSYMILIGMVLILILFIGAITTAMQRRNLAE